MVALAARAPAPPLTTRIAFVVPVFDTDPAYLDALVASVRAQRAGAWELILSDDGSTAEATRAWLDRNANAPDLVILRGANNLGIHAATNAGCARATAEWIGLLDHDDALAPYAVDRILAALAGAPSCRFLYTDEVIADADLKPVDLFLKPAFDPVMLSGVNYVNHLSLYRRDRLAAIGGQRPGFQGSQDYDLVLRYTRGLAAADCLHVPYPAYIWRRDGRSYSSLHLDDATRTARRALAEAYARDGVEPEIGEAIDATLHRVRFDVLESTPPLVSVVIPNRDAFALIAQVLHGLTQATDYPRLEIIVVDNGSVDPRVLALYDEMRAGPTPFEALVEPEPFNFSRAINKGVARAKGDYVLLLNNDIEVLEPGWLAEMVSCFAYPDVAIVGAKLLYPDRTIQHAGVIVGFGGLAGHWYLQAPWNFPGPLGRLWVRQSLSCVTGACMLVSRQTFAALGPLDEDAFAIAYNDVDLCMRAVKAGRRVVWTPFAMLVHHESASRGSDETPENIARFRREQDNLRAHHATDRYTDPAINPWYSTDRSTPIIVTASQLPKAR